MILIAVDACCMINLLRGGVLVCISSALHLQFAFQGLVFDEIMNDQATLRSLVEVGRAVEISGHDIYASEVANIATKHNIGLGEAECIVVGAKIGSLIASDDRK